MAATTLLTSDQFLALPEEFDLHWNKKRQELICGEVVDSPPSGKQDAIVRSNILEALFAYLHANPAIDMIALSRAAFVVSLNSVLIPDVAVLVRSRVNTADTYLQGAPDLAIEVIEPADLEVHRKSKIDAYRNSGARSLWIVYPEVRSVMTYEANTVREFKGDQSITDPLLPGFSSPLAAFFELT